MEIRQVIPTREDVVSLIDQLNTYQIGLYGLAACNLEAPESLVKNNAYMLGAFEGKKLVGIGGVKLVNDYAEVKRMFVLEEYRGKHVAESILAKLEEQVFSCGIRSVYLETGNLHHAAMRFYRRMGYQEVEFFGNYRPNAVSRYFFKKL